jgi:hypothetical protein
LSGLGLALNAKRVEWETSDGVMVAACLAALAEDRHQDAALTLRAMARTRDEA